MSSSTSWFLRSYLGFAAAAVVLSLGDAAHGQEGLPQGYDKTTVTKAFDKNNTLLNRLLRGDELFDPKKKEHVDAMEAGAKFMTCRFFWYADDTTSGIMDKFYQEFEEKHLKPILKNKTDKQEVAQAYTKAVIEQARFVLNTDKAIARLNAARLLAKLAELGQGELADELIRVFTDEQGRDDKSTPKRNDGVKYYVLRGMRDLLALPTPEAPAPPVLTPERQRKLAETLLAFVNKPVAFPEETPKDEVAGFHALWREAIRALAYCQAPGLKGKERPGMTLLRIMAQDGFTPKPRIDERYEAALGVARMRPASDGKEYQPEYAAYQIGQLVVAFGQDYTASKEMDKAKEPQRPYRIYAAKLLEALEAMKNDLKNAYVNLAVDNCRLVLLQVEKGESVAKTFDLSKWLQANMPPKNSLFQGVADSTVKPVN